MKVSEIINNYLVWFILLAAVLGVFLPQFSFLSNYVSWILFFMILGLGFTLELKEFVGIAKTPWKVLIAVLVMYSIIPLVAFLLAFLIADKDLAIGTLIIGVAPAEITSALMVYLANGNLALGTTIMSFSILLSPFIMPWLLSILIGGSVNIDAMGMFKNLLLIVVLPLLIGSFFRTKFKQLEKYKDEFSSLSSVMVILLIFVVAANSAEAILDVSILGLVLLLLIFNFFGYFIGYLTAKILKIKEFKSYIFTIGMKEFGVATAVALQFFGSKVAIPIAIYGIIILITAPIIAKILRNE
ncbi:MAG: bile acid:sodium symporter family protein [Nanoarchaeota archaeon]|nr:bile acid:sodium symporter family protein [Nanoarchaeota archaeon]